MLLLILDWSGSVVGLIGALVLAGLAFGIWRRYSKPVAPDDFRYELGVVCAMANEAPYVKEWLSWHRDQGVEHFFIYDNDSWENDYEELFGKSLLPHITVQRWVGKKVGGIFGQSTPQRQAYNHAMKNFAGLCRYVLVCDLDEFAMPAPGSPHSRLIDVLKELPENAAWVEITRYDYGHRPHQTRPEGGVVDNYVWRCAIFPKNSLKSMIRGEIAGHLSWWRGVHRPRWKIWSWPLRGRGWVHHVDDERLIRINHYHTKSAEEWKERGRFWESNRFNKGSGLRVAWREEPPPLYSEVEDDHAQIIKTKVTGGAVMEGD